MLPFINSLRPSYFHWLTDVVAHSKDRRSRLAAYVFTIYLSDIAVLIFGLAICIILFFFIPTPFVSSFILTHLMLLA